MLPCERQRPSSILPALTLPALNRNDDDEDIKGAAIPEDGQAKPGFGSLKSVLSAVAFDYKVRSQFAPHNSSLINPAAGKRRHEKQGRRSSLPDRQARGIL